MVPGKATMPLTAGTGQPVREDVTPTGRDTPASGKVIVARAPRSSSPLRSAMCASHGPAGSRRSSVIATGSVSPIPSVTPSAAAIGFSKTQ
jgi:hypothetical protein